MRAAETLHLTQPAVSMQMKRLSEMVGVALFAKRGRNLYLTRAGKALLPYVRLVMGTLREADEEIDAIKGLRHGKVKIGMVTTTHYFAPRLTAQFKAKHPDVELDIAIANRKNVISKLENNQIDLAIMGRTPSRLSVDAEEFSEHPYVIIAPKSHPLVGKKNIEPYELQSEHFLARESGSGTRMILDHFFAKNDLKLPSTQEFSSNESIKQSVMAGMGMAFISAHTIHLEAKSGLLEVLDVTGMPALRTWYILHLVNKNLSPAANAFKQFMQQEAPEHMQEIFA